MRARALARVIALSDGGCYVVFPAWSTQVAVFMDTLPPGFGPDLTMPHRTHATITLSASDPQDLEPEWCE